MSAIVPLRLFFTFIEVLESLKLGLLSRVVENVWFGVFKCITRTPIMACIEMQGHFILEVQDEAKC